MKLPPVEYEAPTTVAEAVDLLTEHGDEASVLAGGQSLIPLLALRLARPEVLIDINGIDELSGVSVIDGRVAIGAMTREYVAEESGTVADTLPLLAAALPLASLPGMPSTASPGRGRATLAWQRRRASSGRPAAGSYTPAPAGTRPVGRWGAPVCGPSTPPRPHRVLRSHTASHGRRPEPITRGRGERP